MKMSEKLKTFIQKEYKEVIEPAEPVEDKEWDDRAEAIKAKGEDWFGGVLIEAMIEHYNERDGCEMFMEILDESDLYKCHYCKKSPAPRTEPGDDGTDRRLCKNLGCEWDREHPKKSETQ